jgi:hypothetical protein
MPVQPRVASVRSRGFALAAFVLVALLVVGACGGDDDSSTPAAKGPNPTSSDPGPNPTSFDPGPNPTNNGPVTREGTLVITPGCLTLVNGTTRLDLRFPSDYAAKGTGLIDDTGSAIAHRGDHIAVAGHPASGTNTCGTRFNVESLVTVVPKQ